MIDPAVLLAFVLTVLAYLGTPGPVTLAVLTLSRQNGWRATAAFIVGTNLSSLVLIAVSSLVLFGLLTLHPAVLTWLRLPGALFLLWFGAQFLRSFFRPADTPPAPESGLKLFARGLSLGLSNPKDILFFLAFFPQFLTAAPQRGPALLILTATWIALDYLLLFTYALAAKTLLRPAVLRWLNLAAGVLFVLIGLFAAVESVLELTQS